MHAALVKRANDLSGGSCAALRWPQRKLPGGKG